MRADLGAPADPRRAERSPLHARLAANVWTSSPITTSPAWGSGTSPPARSRSEPHAGPADHAVRAERHALADRGVHHRRPAHGRRARGRQGRSMSARGRSRGARRSAPWPARTPGAAARRPRSRGPARARRLRASAAWGRLLRLARMRQIAELGDITARGCAAARPGRRFQRAAGGRGDPDAALARPPARLRRPEGSDVPDDPAAPRLRLLRSALGVRRLRGHPARARPITGASWSS